ncbi:DUF4935 domain-containing protein [Sporosarcina sp. Marseille-Q4063]|uniref:PIN domain-containing protein n=1 Tax=Sporosarcina sp. Marseille-Q4063 TaxID=2810514 RepID=UPI001BB008C4|nr:PIN domain-containing protein [Sporosarcina sp. Marseille-Q4063]QUW22475.1 DUF4935 domain-containing protein [Sporosarcina sp. Marseille-Q4063]
MTIGVFLDSNIIMSDYKMQGISFVDFFRAHEELNNDEKFKLILTEMNYYEIISNFKRELNKSLTKYSSFKNEILKLTELDFDTNIKELKTKIIKNYEQEIKALFYIKSPTEKAASNVFNRFYHQKMPFRDNKSEFKDALIWETVYEYAINNQDEKIYFISNNHKDFAPRNGEKAYVLHEHFDSLNNRIKYINGISDFLIEINHLKIHHFDFNEEEEVLSTISQDLRDNYFYSPVFEGEMYDFFSNNDFSYEFFEGWGTDYTAFGIYDIEITDSSQVLETEDFFYLPIRFIAEIEYSVEYRNPAYEKMTGDEEFLQSGSNLGSFYIKCLVKYDPENKKVVEVEGLEIDFI